MKNIARIVLITAGLIWGLGFIGNKYILLSGWTDIQLLFVRFVSGTIFIFIIFFHRIKKADRKLIKTGLFLGVFLFFGFYFQTVGLTNTSASNNALITAGYIVVMPLLAYVIDRVKVPSTTIIAGFVTLFGIALISVDFSNMYVSEGDAMTFLGAIVWAVHIYLLGKYTRKFDLFALMAYQLLMFSIMITVLLFITNGLPQETMGYDGQFNLWVIGILLGFFCSFIAFTLQAFGQKHTNAAEAAILISTESVFGPIFAILLLNEPFNNLLLIGMILVFGGIVLSETGEQIKIKFKAKKKDIA